MCAMMPIFRVLSSATVRGINTLKTTESLPAIVGESLVGFGHSMRVVLLLDGIAAIICGVHQLPCEFLLHGFLTPRARIQKQPSDAEGSAARRTHFNGHLVGGTADAPGFHCKHRLDVLDRFLEGLDGIVGRLLLD